MAIESPSVTAIEHSSDTSTAIEVVSTRPALGLLDIPTNPGRLLGYYNASSDVVELYVADQNGRRWIPVLFNG